MESSLSASSVLISPLAVDDVFRQQSVPEVQEVLRQLQLQQANDAEELRSLVGVRYLSFLEGLPAISSMQKVVEEALKETREFGLGLHRLASSLASDYFGRRDQQQQQEGFESGLPLQKSTPLDDLLCLHEVDSSPYVSSPCHVRQRDWKEGTGNFRRFPHFGEKRQNTQQHLGSLRYLQQQLLLLPSRVWDAVRSRKFLEAARLVLIEGSKRAETAKAVVCELWQQQHWQQRDKQYLEQQLSGCWALAQQTMRSSSSFTSSLRALALRQLASPELRLSVAADAAAAATLLYLFDRRASLEETSETELIASAAKWLLGVFFSARGEAMESIMTRRKTDGKVATVPAPYMSDFAGSDPTEISETVLLAVHAAEATILAFSASIEAAEVLFAPLAADGAARGDRNITGSPSTGVSAGGFAAVRAAEATLCASHPLDSVDISWALRALARVFALLAAHCRSDSCNNREWGLACCCDDDALCPRARTAAFVQRWSTPLKMQLCLFPSEDPQRSLRDIRVFWLILLERLKTMRCHWRLPIRSLFVISDTPQRSSTELDAGGNQHWAYSDMPLPPCTLCLLQALGESCSNACIAVCERRMRALPLLSQHIGNNEACRTRIFPLVKDECSNEAFKKDLWFHLTDIAALFGDARSSQGAQAAVPLRAAVAASFLQSLSECIIPLKQRAILTAATTTNERAEELCIRVQDTSAAMIMDARRVEWLFTAFGDAEASSDHDNEVALGGVSCIWDQTPEGSTAVKCRQRLAAFLSEWTLSTSRAQNNAAEVFEKGSCPGEHGHEDGLETCPVVATARAAAQSILPDLYFSSFVAYAVGFWPFVRLAVKELQAVWQWSSGTSAAQATEAGETVLDVSGGAMSFLLDVSRHVVASLKGLKVKELSDCPVLLFAMKVVASEEVASIAVAAIKEAKERQQQRLDGHYRRASLQRHLLQVLVDTELLAEALDGYSPLTRSCKGCESLNALPATLRKIIEVGAGCRRCSESLREATDKGRQWLEPVLATELEKRVGAGFSASKSLIWPLLPSTECEAGGIGPSGFKEIVVNAPLPPLLEPNERLPLLPVSPLPAFEWLLLHSPHEAHGEADESAQKPVVSKTGSEHQLPPKELHKQLHRLRLDDVVAEARLIRGRQWRTVSTEVDGRRFLWRNQGCNGCFSSRQWTSRGLGKAGWARQCFNWSPCRVSAVASRAGRFCWPQERKTSIRKHASKHAGCPGEVKIIRAILYGFCYAAADSRLRDSLLPKGLVRRSMATGTRSSALN